MQTHCVDIKLLETPSTHHRDYILTDYEPLCDPKGRWHGATLLRFALREAGLLSSVWPMLEALRIFLGPEEIVWGIKYSKRFSVELYFYDYASAPTSSPKSVSRLSKVLSPFIAMHTRVNQAWPVFMWSFDLDEKVLKKGIIQDIHLYFGNEESPASTGGFSYRIEGSECILENHYQFYKADSKDGRLQVYQRLRRSPRGGDGASPAALIPRYLLDCHSICYSVKPRSDALYFSRISTAQLVQFLSKFMPGPLRDFLQESADALAHLRWDIGYDFRSRNQHNGSIIEIPKLGIYGVI